MFRNDLFKFKSIAFELKWKSKERERDKNNNNNINKRSILQAIALVKTIKI